MPEQINGWLASGGTAVTGAVALAQGGLFGGVTLLIVGAAVSIRTAGPELREWRLLGRTLKAADKEADAIEPSAAGTEDMSDAA